MSFANWMIDSLASEDVIDLYFILSDLIDVRYTDSEMLEDAALSSLSSAQLDATVEDREKCEIPLGKQVW